jgi:hypothetical protein
MKETEAHIEISSSKDMSLTFLVTGKQNAVLEARRKILTHFQTQVKLYHDEASEFLLDPSLLYVVLLWVVTDHLCGLVVRVPGYRTEMYCAFCEVRTEFIYVL